MKKIKILGIVFLSLILLSLSTFADTQCVAQDCYVNLTLNVVNATVPTPTPTGASDSGWRTTQGVTCGVEITPKEITLTNKDNLKEILITNSGYADYNYALDYDLDKVDIKSETKTVISGKSTKLIISLKNKLSNDESRATVITLKGQNCNDILITVSLKGDNLIEVTKENVFTKTILELPSPFGENKVFAVNSIVLSLFITAFSMVGLFLIKFAGIVSIQNKYIIISSAIIGVGLTVVLMFV